MSRMHLFNGSHLLASEALSLMHIRLYEFTIALREYGSLKLKYTVRKYLK